MTFEVGRLSAALTLDGVQEFHQGLDAAGRKLNDTGQKGASFGKAGEAAVRAAAGATTGLVTAAGAYLAILTKTGVGYNSLQQNSRAALSVLLGGAQQANAQMDKLDSFARNSPFSKSVFIQAQQQLIGFGMEAGKVIPTLDAIQQGVAAMGGSNEQIPEVVNILAKVQSTGKFTAETLNELGYRGVDAATLMGNAMGKTAAQMREDISEGAIGGAEAIDVLVSAMQDRFGGAADGVKQQWSGAVDRIKAANRDLGAHIAEPFVSAQGGGMAVTWGNQVADVLRAIEKQAVPVMGILTQRGMPFFAALTQGLDSTAAAIKRWNPESFSVTLDKLGNHAPGIAALAGATLALGANVGPLGQMLSVLGISANPAVAAFVALAAVSPELRTSLMGVVKAGEPLLPVVGELAQILSGTLNSALPVVAGGLDAVASILEVVLGVVASIPTPVLAGATAFLAMHAATKSLNAPLSTVLGLLQQFGQRAAVQAALGETSGAMGALSTASMSAKAGVESLGTAMKTAFLSNPIGIALTVVAGAVALWAVANANAQKDIQAHKDGVAELKDTLNATTGALTEATEAKVKSSLADTRAKELAEEMNISYSDMEQAILGNEEALARVTAGIDAHAAATTTGDKNMDSWSATATNGANRVREFSEILDEHRSRVEEAQQAKRDMIQADREAAAALTDAARSNQRFNEALEVARDATADAETRVRALKQALDELSGGSRTARQAQTDLNETSLNLADALSRADENGTKLWQSFVTSSGAIETSTQAGIDFERMLYSANDKMGSAIQLAVDEKLAHDDRAGAMRAAIEVGNEHISKIQETLVAGGMEEEQARRVAQAYLDVPSLVATLLTTEGSASEVGQEVLGIMEQLAGLGEGQTIQIDAEGAEETAQILSDIGVQIELSADGKHYVITSEGSDVVAQQLSDLAATQPPNKLFKIEANAMDAYSKIDGVNVKQIDKKTAVVWGENGKAIEAIEAINRKNPDRKVVTITGDSSSFESVWSSVVGRVGSAWVSIFGEKGNFSGGMYGADGQHFDAGGFPSGMYAGVNGGIRKPGIDGIPHVFAEAELGVPWEAYISGKPQFRERNIGLALEALRRLAFPVIPVSALGGTRAFAGGGSVGVSAPEVSPATPRAATEWNMTIVNPVVRDPFQQAWDEVHEKGAF